MRTPAIWGVPQPKTLLPFIASSYDGLVALVHDVALAHDAACGCTREAQPHES